MKTMLRLFTVLAFTNLLAFAGFLLWLKGSDRLSAERVAAVRAIFAPTIGDEARLFQESSGKAEEAVRLAAEERRLLETPMTRSEQIVAMERFEQRATLAVRALEDERRRMLADLSTREAAVTAREADFAARQSAWEESVADAKLRATDEQFRKAVKLLEAMPPKQGKEWIVELMSSGRGSTAVAYLDAMSPSKFAGLLKAFKDGDDAKVATDLLERLRQLGLERETGLDRTNAANSAQSPAESAGAGRPTAPGALPGGRANGPSAGGPSTGGPSANGPLGVS